jgi:outer membrane protein assembly factor BamB
MDHQSKAYCKLTTAPQPLRTVFAGLVLVALSASAGAAATDPVPDLEVLPAVKWKLETSKPFMASPVISGNTVFIGGLDSVLYAVDTRSGKVGWKFRTGGEIRSNVLVDKERVFLAGGDGTMYCLSRDKGELYWKWVFNKTASFLGERRYDIADYFNSSPVICNNTIYFGSGDGNLYAVGADSGNLIWNYNCGDIIHVAPVLYKDKVIVGSFNGNVYALNAANGNLVWKFKSVGQEYFPKGEMQGTPVVFNGLVVIGSRDYNLYAINADTGYCHWNQQFPKGWALANAVQDSVLYVGTSDDKYLAAKDPATGKEIWRTDLKFNVFSPCTFSANMLYVGNLMGKVFGIDRATGQIRWTFTTDGYLANHDRFFKADDTFSDQFFSIIKNNVDYISAQLTWGAVFSSPAIGDHLLVVSSTDGKLYCLQS